MAEVPGDPERLQLVAANRDVLARLADGAARASDGDGPWSPDGWVMRTHPDVTEALESAARGDVRMVYGIPTLVDAADRIYAVGLGTGRLWLRVPPGRALNAAVARGEAEPVEGLAGWTQVDAWRTDWQALARAASASADHGDPARA